MTVFKSLLLFISAQRTLENGYSIVFKRIKRIETYPIFALADFVLVIILCLLHFWPLKAVNPSILNLYNPFIN